MATNAAQQVLPPHLGGPRYLTDNINPANPEEDPDVSDNKVGKFATQGAALPILRGCRTSYWARQYNNADSRAGKDERTRRRFRRNGRTRYRAALAVAEGLKKAADRDNTDEKSESLRVTRANLPQDFFWEMGEEFGILIDQDHWTFIELDAK